MLQQPVEDAPERRSSPSAFQRLADRAWNAVEQSRWFSGIVGFYHAHEQYAPALFFFGGVAWDASTLRRIDAWFDNVFLLTYLILLGALITTSTLAERGLVRQPWVRKYKGWFPAAIQFFLGALFSAYVVYYSQSASLTETSAYLLVLMGLLVANEFIHRRAASLYLLFGLYFLAAFSFFIFAVPTLTRSVGYVSFLLGGVLAVLLVGGILRFLDLRRAFDERREFVLSLGVVLGLFGLMNLFYVQNWIPPVPLALRHGGVYHEVVRHGDTFELSFERPPWYKFWVDSDETFQYTEGEAVYCFAAVFAPTDLKAQIFHEWRYYDEAQRAWVSTDRIGYVLVGGRDGGWRGYTMKRNVRPGQWRVDVQTADRRTLGRIRFDVVAAEEPVIDLERIAYQ